MSELVIYILTCQSQCCENKDDRQHRSGTCFLGHDKFVVDVRQRLRHRLYNMMRYGTITYQCRPNTRIMNIYLPCRKKNGPALGLFLYQFRFPNSFSDVAGIPNTGIPAAFSVPKSRDWASPNPGIAGLKNGCQLSLAYTLWFKKSPLWLWFQWQC